MTRVADDSSLRGQRLIVAPWLLASDNTAHSGGEAAKSSIHVVGSRDTEWQSPELQEGSEGHWVIFTRRQPG